MCFDWFLQHLTVLCWGPHHVYQAEIELLLLVLSGARPSKSCWKHRDEREIHTPQMSRVGVVCVCVSDSRCCIFLSFSVSWFSAPEQQQEPRWASAWGPESLWPETHTHTDTDGVRETVLSLISTISLQSVLTVRAFSTYLLYRSSIRLMSSSFFLRISCSSSTFFATETDTTHTTHTHTHTHSLHHSVMWQNLRYFCRTIQQL